MERCEMSVSELGTPHLTNFRTEIFWIEQLSNLFLDYIQTHSVSGVSLIYLCILFLQLFSI